MWGGLACYDVGMTNTRDDNRMPVLIGLGEVLWDCFSDYRRPGGAPANVAFHASQFGLRGRLCSRVGADELGREIVGYLGALGVDVGLVQRDGAHATGTVSVEASDPTSPGYTIHAPVAWDYLEATAAWVGACGEADAVCFGTLAQRGSASREAIRRCLGAASGAWSIYDVNLRPPHYEAEVIDASLRLADVVKLNHEEIEVLHGLLGTPVDPEAFAGVLFARYGVSRMVLTRGARGCLALGPDEEADVAGKAVRVVDAVGAGDAFTAGFAYGLLTGWPLGPTARLANEVGALVASQSGAMPALRSEFASLCERVWP